MLVRPDEPIPASSTRIHGIDDAAVAAANGFAGVWPAFSAFIGDHVVIGHTLGFDLAVLKRECDRAGARLEAPARSRHAAPGGGRAAQSRRLLARSGRRLARRDRRRAPLGTRRRDDHRAGVPRPVAETAGRRHPHLGGSRAGLPRTDRRARGAAPRGLAGAGGSAEPPGCGTPARPHRHLSLSPSYQGRDERAAPAHRRRREHRRCPRGHGGGAHLLAVRDAAGGGPHQAADRRYRNHHRTRRHAGAGRLRIPRPSRRRSDRS